MSTKEIDDLRSIRSISIDSLSGISTSGSNLAISKIRSSAGSGSELAVLDDSRTLRKVGRSGQKWERKLPSAEFAGISQSGDYLFVWARSGDVIVIDSITGRTILEFRLSAAPSGSFSVDRKVVYAGSEDGSVFSIDRVDGEIQWSSRTGGTIDDLTAEKKGVLAISRDNFVYFLSDGNGRRIWKRKLAGRIIGSTKIGKNFAAFLSYGTNEVSILRLQDGKLVNSFPVEGAAHFVSAPLSAGDFLLVPFDSGLAAFAPKGICEREKDGS
ncbi:MAG TPA: PQQ-binding-like beta-propeller repeat protein [Aridibacter sp.]|nr:PQQ-binding-like beta-propeller repeat protein [Aridibacter sp.]